MKGWPPPPQLLITTNLDNDDALAADAVELLQREIRFSSGKRIYSLLYGYQYFTDRRFALKMRYTNNHFLTLAEPFDAHTETIISYRHTKAIRQLPTTYLSTARGKWLEIVHEDNVSNDFRINIKVWYIPCSGVAGSPISACLTSMFRDCGSGSARCASFPRGFWSRRSGVCAASGRCGGLRYLSTGYLLLKRNPTPSIR
ncbi:MAG: glycosyltransferase [Alistipes finegoldii]